MKSSTLEPGLSLFYTRENASVSVAVKSDFLIESDVKEHY